MSMRNKSKYFDVHDYQRLQIFSLMIKKDGDIYTNFLDPLEKDNFISLRFCKRYNILKLYPHQTNIKTLNFTGHMHDALYINTKARKNQTCDTCIYITPHITYCFQPNHKSLLSVIDNSLPNVKEKFDRILAFPKLNLWSYDNYSVEFINDPYINKRKFPTLGTFINQDTEQAIKGLKERKVKYLDIFLNFINSVGEVFQQINYLPYMIHPNRLLLYNEYIKVISGNLFVYIFTPHNENNRIKSATYSHPITFNNIINKDKNYDGNILTFLHQCTINVISDFFHSSFVTLLWLYTIGKYECNYIIKRNHSIISNTTCKFDHGFCKIFQDDKVTLELVHKYGCIHLLEVLPKLVKEGINESQTVGGNDPFKMIILNLFNIFKNFIIELKNGVSPETGHKYI